MGRGVLVLVAGLLEVAAVAGAGTTALVPLRLVGSYETVLPRGQETQSGRWVLAIGRHGAFVLTTPGLSALAAGPARVSGSTITLPPDAARGGTCKGPGIYSWRVSGTRLSLAKVDDACTARAFRLTARSWKRFTDYSPVVIVRR